MTLFSDPGKLQVTVGQMVPSHRVDQFGSIGIALDWVVKRAVRASGKRLGTVRYLMPSRVVAAFTDDNIYVVMSEVGAGMGGVHHYIGMPPSTTLADVEDIGESTNGLRQPIAFTIPNAVLDNAQDSAPWVDETARAIIQAGEAQRQEADTVRFDPIFRGKEFSVDPSLVFTLSPFGEPFDRIYTDVVKPTVEGKDGLHCLRADDINDNNAIIEDVWRLINQARVVIADITGGNPNVFYELGIAHTIGKETVLLMQEGGRAPFDLTHLRHIRYSDSSLGLKSLAHSLRLTLETVLKRPEGLTPVREKIESEGA